MACLGKTRSYTVAMANIKNIQTEVYRDKVNICVRSERRGIIQNLFFLLLFIYKINP